MTQPMSAEPEIEPRLLRGWISRYDLAQELGLTVDTLGRWERRRKGPACVRAGRKIFYRMSVVQDWLQSQEMPRVADSKADNASKARGRK
ncbi:hypothetical protein SAMN04488021_14431 [Paracoccus aminovorans]|uniref:Helix-turn-helix domain-containing protein n=1 Tax=Paracoccus aminovorans TaxID=34004 RepID=A0A1I3E377_9RHOB|nr:transcriptional regulator [Paracoccus aminovorans]CQR84652.1 hypothetical protein JCM7685_0059 [Paracoccus aminovorans]SFH93151.1 hypothetical protein SAMN04488021_14431 [Paracoccus aminovorans]